MIGKGSKKTKKGDRQIKFLTCKYANKHDKRGEGLEKVRQRTTQKTECKVKVKCKEDVDRSWVLSYVAERHLYNYEANDP